MFVQHRDKDLERRNTEAAKAQTDGGVACPEGSASRAIAAGAASAPSWLARLELVRSLIGQNKGISSDTLAASAAFLSWISTGTIACAEDGEHHRPNRAAETSRDVFVNLETVAGTLYTKHGTRVGEVEKQLMRQVHPWLPSFSGEFTCSVPMTRIRDIAHRGDIPQELKKEIKYTLQNKIHRNAGPEDLVAVQAMWERVEHSDYSEDFKYQFRLFNEELRRFFNAAGATERLDALAESLEEDHRAAADEFRDAMRALDDGSAGHDGMVGGEGEAVLRALRASATCRAHFTRALSTGMRNDAPDDAVAQRQAFRLAEIALEESAFVIMARALACAGAGVDGETDASGGSSYFSDMLSAGDGAMWTRACEAASESLRHLSLSGWRSAECDAAAREMFASGAAFDASDPETALRVVAALQRTRRVVEAHTAAILDGFGDAPANLGRSFGLPPHVGEQYAESVVRAGVPFQLSRLVAPMLRAASDIAGCNRGGFDSIVMGVAVGRLVEATRWRRALWVDPRTDRWWRWRGRRTATRRCPPRARTFEASCWRAICRTSPTSPYAPGRNACRWRRRRMPRLWTPRGRSPGRRWRSTSRPTASPSSRRRRRNSRDWRTKPPTARRERRRRTTTRRSRRRRTTRRSRRPTRRWLRKRRERKPPPRRTRERKPDLEGHGKESLHLEGHGKESLRLEGHGKESLHLGREDVLDLPFLVVLLPRRVGGSRVQARMPSSD